MKSITVDGKDYVKASVIARDLGYTADYVGQLCRGKKVDAQLVGRSWYVSEDSLRDHKQGRYRSNKKATVREVEKTLKTVSADSDDSSMVAVHVVDEKPSSSHVGYANQSFYRRAESVATPMYHQDDADLLPETVSVPKGGKVDVRLAGAQSIHVSSKNKTFDFNPSKRPELKFRGRLSVTEVEDEISEEEVNLQKTDEKPILVAVSSEKEMKESVRDSREIKNKLDDKASKIKVKHRRPTTKKRKRNVPLEHNSDGVVGMQRGRIMQRNPVGGTLRMNTPLKQQKRGAYGFVLVVTSLCAIILAILATTAEQNLYVVNGEIVVRYSLDMSSVLAAAYDAFR